MKISFRSIVDVFKSRDEIAAYKTAFTETDDPGFGVVNTDGRIADIMVSDRVATLRGDLASSISMLIRVVALAATRGRKAQ